MLYFTGLTANRNLVRILHIACVNRLHRIGPDKLIQVPASSQALSWGMQSMIAESQFNRSTLDCMTLLRRRLKQTLGVNIRLSQPDAPEQLVKHASDCEQAEIRELGQRLHQLLTPDAPEPVLPQVTLAQGAIESRTYKAERKPVAEPEPQSRKPGGSVRVYRGQVISN